MSRVFDIILLYYFCGYKCGHWNDVAWFEKQIGEYDGLPTEILSIQQLNNEGVENILDRCCQLIK